MEGWKLKEGNIVNRDLNEDKIWSLFNSFFNDGHKTNSYKFGFLKSLLDNAFNGEMTDKGVKYTFNELFYKFTYNYWNLVVKYNLNQMRHTTTNSSKIEQILKSSIINNDALVLVYFESIDDYTKNKIVKDVKNECKKYVVGAMYGDFEQNIYSFNLKNETLILNPCFYNFMLKHKMELEKLNYYSWAKFLEEVNKDNELIRVIDKLELATPKRSNLTVYRDILRKEFEENTCFYCGKKLQRIVHVDHFIPWSFVKDDKIWNFVLSCPTCNIKKNNRVPSIRYLKIIEERNNKIQHTSNEIVKNDFMFYTPNVLNSMWKYAKQSGLKDFE